MYSGIYTNYQNSGESYALVKTRKHQYLKQNLHSNISSTNTFHTLLDIANISYEDEIKKQSFADSTFQQNQLRYFQKVDGTLMQLK